MFAPLRRPASSRARPGREALKRKGSKDLSLLFFVGARSELDEARLDHAWIEVWQQGLQQIEIQDIRGLVAPDQMPELVQDYVRLVHRAGVGLIEHIVPTR